MSRFQYPDLTERQSSAASAKKALLEKFRAKAEDPSMEEVRAARAAIHQARLVREAEREAARQAREAELAAERARQAELAEKARLEAEAKAEKARREAEELAAIDFEIAVDFLVTFSEVPSFDIG